MRARLKEAHDQHAGDLAALTRGRQRLADAEAAIADLAAQDAEAIQRHADRLEAQTRGGSTSPLPSLVPSESELIAATTARRTVQAAERMVASLELSEMASRAALAELVDLEQRIRSDRKAEEADRIAAKLKSLRDQERQLCSLLAAVSLDAPQAFTPAASEALDNPPARPTSQAIVGAPGGVGMVFDINSPIGGEFSALDAARDFWESFDTTLESAAVAA